MKVILTTKKETENLKKITDLLNLVLFNYNINVIEKSKLNDKKNKKKVIKKDKKVIKKQQEIPKKAIVKNEKYIEKNIENRINKREWLEDYYYSQRQKSEEFDKVVNYYSDKKRVSDYY